MSATEPATPLLPERVFPVGMAALPPLTLSRTLLAASYRLTVVPLPAAFQETGERVPSARPRGPQRWFPVITALGHERRQGYKVLV